MTQRQHRDRASFRTSRRTMLAGSVLALCAGVAGDQRIAAAQGMADPLTPVRIPPQAPAKEGIAQLTDARLWFWDTGGAGEPIVLLHPASGSGLIWGYQQPAFAKAGYRVISYSRRGYYGSAPVDRAKPGIASEDLHELVEFLGLGKFHIVASAAGGSVASDYAFSHPDRLLSLTVSSNQFGVADGEIFAAGARIRPAIWDEIPVEIREVGPSYRARNPEGFKQWIELERKSGLKDAFRQPLKNRITEAMLANLNVPTLVICGAADLATPPSIARMIAARIPHAELVVAPEAGHSVYWEEPELFNRAVLTFIAKHGR
ncbi:MAG TPA: alpha/beta hydrolase [Xanthobacteraceae bacterium]|nr:alpha/beta hydrolase [Xanthobacteraceae bacterium]